MGKLVHESRKIFTKGLRRAEVRISLKNLTYNLYRFAALAKRGELCTIKQNATKFGINAVKFGQISIKSRNEM